MTRIYCDGFYKTEKTPIVILNYPRCGSCFLEYCIKEICGEDLWKTHGAGGYWEHAPFEGTIFMIRNYKECIPRQLPREAEFNLPLENGAAPPDLDLNTSVREFYTGRLCRRVTVNMIKNHMSNARSFDESTNTYKTEDYITVLNHYNTLDEDNKMIIYYEDFVENTPKELSRVMEFLKKYGLKPKKYDNFIENMEHHRKKSLKLYKPGSESGGQSALFHSLKIPLIDRIELDYHLEDNYNDLWEKYLKRYKEKPASGRPLSAHEKEKIRKHIAKRSSTEIEMWYNKEDE